MEILERARAAWNREAAAGGEWSIPVDPAVIREAREGRWEVILTPVRPVPRSWFGELAGKEVLCLASGGGQQAPVLAAAGARVTSFDLSDVQLEKDRQVAERDGLSMRCVRGDMADLYPFADATFDLIFHPVSNVFAPDVTPIWRECFRVLRPGGHLLAGFMNPAFFLFDHEEAERTGDLVVRHVLPYAEPESLSPEARRSWHASGRAAEFSHSLELLIGGQLQVGFVITGFYEDAWTNEATPLNRFTPVALATHATKPSAGDPTRSVPIPPSTGAHDG